MTIAAGLICEDGVVLCADTQLTANYKQQGQKLWLHRKSGVSVVVSGAGDYSLLKLANEHIRRRLRARYTIHQVRHGLLEPILSSIHADHIDKAPDWRVQTGYDLDLLVAVKSGAKVILYDTSRTSVSEVGDYRCFGTGAPVANYIAGTMFSASLSVFWGQVLAAYLIQQTKTYGQDCGGNSYVAVVPKSGDAYLLSPEKLKQMEGVGNRIHEAIGPVLFSCASGLSGSEFDQIIWALRDAVERSRAEISGEMYRHIWTTQFSPQAKSRARTRFRKPPKRDPKDQPPSQA